MTTYDDLLDELAVLLDRIETAPTVTAFDEHGNGPILSIADNNLVGDPGPIRRQATRVRTLLREAVLDSESAMRRKGSL